MDRYYKALDEKKAPMTKYRYIWKTNEFYNHKPTLSEKSISVQEEEKAIKPIDNS
jgi:hypothetical protein